MKAVHCVLPDLKLALVAVLAGLLLLIGPAETAAKGKLFETYKQVIVIDPGHGGADPGARGPNGTLEKTVTLKLARILATELEEQYHVVLTRSDDYRVDIDTRTAQANHLQADLFISLHTGGSFVHRTAGAMVFYYQGFSAGSAGSQKAATPRLWQDLQNRHSEASRLLASLINNRLNSLESIEQNRVQGAPLAVLQGADMPAVLIEPGYLTNPTEEARLHDRHYLIALATAIRRGIEDFFARQKR